MCFIITPDEEKAGLRPAFCLERPLAGASVR